MYVLLLLTLTLAQTNSTEPKRYNTEPPTGWNETLHESESDYEYEYSNSGTILSVTVISYGKSKRSFDLASILKLLL